MGVQRPSDWQEIAAGIDALDGVELDGLLVGELERR